MSRVDDDPIGALCRAFVRSMRGWLARSSSFVNADFARRHSCTAVVESPVAGTARAAQIAHVGNVSGGLGRNTATLPSDESSTAMKKQNAEIAAASIPWGIAAALRRRAGYRCPLRHRHLATAPWRNSGMNQVGMKKRASSGPWSHGQGCSRSPRSCFATRWRVPVVGGAELSSRSSLWSSGAGVAATDRGGRCR